MYALAWRSRVRLDKFLTETAALTRSEGKKRIKEGRVFVDGLPAKRPEQQVDLETSEVCLDGKRLSYVQYEYYMLHKPAGVVSATEDRKERTVLDLIDSVKKKDLFPVGRLDKDTEGLLLITNDGDLAHRLLSPKKHVDKLYFVRLEKEITEEAVTEFAGGLQVDEELTAKPALLRNLTAEEESSFGGEGFSAAVVITEGKFHQVKRMFQAVDNQVLYLKRMAMGSLYLDETLAVGEYRSLTEAEIEGLKQYDVEK